MITYYYKSVRTDELETIPKSRAGCWVCVEKPSSDEIDDLVAKFDLDPGHMSDSLDEDEMPRLESEGDNLYIFLRYAYVKDDLELTTAPLLFVVTPKVLITVALYSLPRLQNFTGGKLEFSTTQRTKLLLQIFHQVVDQYDVYINNLGKRIKGIRTRLRTHEIVNQDFIDFVTIEDELNEFLSGLQPTSAILNRLMMGKRLPLYRQDEDLIEDLLLSNEQSMAACKSHIKSITSIREAHSTIASNNLNRIMKILTAATVIIALPNVFFGMYGMNVALPFQRQPWAYFAVVSFSVLVVIIVFVVARKKRIF